MTSSSYTGLCWWGDPFDIASNDDSVDGLVNAVVISGREIGSCAAGPSLLCCCYHDAPLHNDDVVLVLDAAGQNERAPKAVFLMTSLWRSSSRRRVGQRRSPMMVLECLFRWYNPTWGGRISVNREAGTA